MINRTPTKSNTSFQTPFEVVYGRKPDGINWKVFRCIAMVHIPVEVRSREATKLRKNQKKKTNSPEKVITGTKLRPAAELMVFIGYTLTGYRFLHPVTNEIQESRDVNYWYENKRLKDIIVEAGTTKLVRNPDIALENQQEKQIEQLQAEHLYANVNIATTRRKRISFLSDSIPKNYKEAINSEHRDKWIQVIECEFNSHEENETWTLTEYLKENKNVISSQWIYSIKYGIDGEEIPKARLVALGCADKNKYTEENIYSPVCPLEVIRLVISIAHKMNLVLTSLDITTAFLYGLISEEIYLRIPCGLQISKDYALRLNKPIYGLKISSKCWYTTLKNEIEKIGFIPLQSERCLFYKRSSCGTISLLAIYAVDMLLATQSDEDREETVHLLKSRFKTKENRNPTSFVGLELRRAHGVINIHQNQYITRMTQTLELHTMNPVTTLMEPYLKIEKSSQVNDDSKFRSLVGILLYISRFSHPDISYSVNTLARHQGRVTSTIKVYARRVMKYVYDSRDLAITYHSNDDQPIRSFCDASYAPDVSYLEDNPQNIEEFSYSTSGFAIYHYGNIINWATSRQTTVATSSTAAEVIAVIENFDSFLLPRDILRKNHLNDTRRQPVSYEDVVWLSCQTNEAYTDQSGSYRSRCSK